MKFFSNKQPGIASLPAILLLGGIIIEIGVAGSLLLFYLNNSIYGTRLANEALSIAQSGIDDATLRIIHDKTYTGTYALDIGDGIVTIDVCKANCAPEFTAEPNSHRIISTGTVLTRQHRLVQISTVDDTTGLVTVDSIKESVQ